MAGPLVTRHRTLFPELMEWLGSGIPTAPAPWTARNAHAIPIEVAEQDGTYLVRAELPGMEPDKDITITLADGILVIRAEHAETTEDKHHTEFRYGTLERAVRLPEPLQEDAVTAEYRHGILTVRVPKAAKAQKNARTIPVHRAE
ncbi:Hsp20/alpha crystallin family protein [Kitasatospora hibisci]|uniref:Hsp20/alpha crystallin family protein n=1 Tax=Kitasatospora hibisci TaxID=3369522 RepID=UPI0037544D25